MKKLILATAVSAAFLAHGAAWAQSAPAAQTPPAVQTPPAAQSPHSVSGNLAFASDYRFRGISQTFRQPALQGGLDYAHSSGFYLGTWGSNVTGSLANGPSYNNGNLEIDAWGGYKSEVAKDLVLDVGLFHYWYPDARYPNAQKTKYDNLELYFGGSYKWLTARYSHGLTDYFGTKGDTYAGYCGLQSNGLSAGSSCASANPGGSKGSGYLDLAANFEVAEKLTLGLHIGHQSVRNYGRFNYTDYKLSLTKEWVGFNWSAAYVGTNANKDWWRAVKNLGPGNGVDVKDPGVAAIVLSVQKNF